MSTDIKKIIYEIPFFSDWDMDRTDFKDISKNKVLVESAVDKVVLVLLPSSSYNEIKKEFQLKDYLAKYGLKHSALFDYGNLADLNLSYCIKPYEEEISLDQCLSGKNGEEQSQLGLFVGDKIEKLHSFVLSRTSVKEFDWKNEFMKNFNYIKYEYGMLQEKRDKDYLLLDYIDNNLYLLENVILKTIHGNLDYRHVRFYENGDLHFHGLRGLKHGDPVYDFRYLNIIAMEFPEFSRGVIEGYFPKGPSKQFFRLLKLYSSEAILEEEVKLRGGKDSLLKGDYLDDFYQIYDDMTLTIPKWYEDDVN